MTAKANRWRWFTRRRIGIACLALCVLGLVWHFLQPPAIRLVAIYHDDVRMTCRDGFLVGGLKPQFIFYDWDGHPRWQVTAPTPKYPQYICPWFTKNGGTSPYALSPDGHFFAVAATEGKRLHVCRWRDGHPSGEQWLTLARRDTRNPNNLLNVGLYCQDSGQMLLWLHTATASPLFILSGNRILATGNLPGCIMLNSDGSFWLPVFPGRMVKMKSHPNISYTEYQNSFYIPDQHGDHISWRKRYTTPVASGDCRGISNNLLLSRDDPYILYGPNGEITRFLHCPWQNSAGTCLINGDNNTFQIYNLQTGKSWFLHIKDHYNEDISEENRSSDISYDGRFVLANRINRPYEIENIISGLNSGLVRDIASRIRLSGLLQSFELYEPGHQIARQRFSGIMPGGIMGIEDADGIFIAPNGRTFLVHGFVHSANTPGGRDNVTALYRWR